MSYSELAIASVILVIVLDLLVIRTLLLATLRFWFSYAIVFAFQLLTNSWLTGANIVMYDDDAIWGFRLANAPVEDLLFGFALIVGTLLAWRVLTKRDEAREAVRSAQ
jgi:lycopene cyclase domain-containing protein